MPPVAEIVPLPSLSLILQQVAVERETMNAHAESLDTKAGVVLGFAGVLVGLGATAQTLVSTRLVFQVGLGVAVLSAGLAAWAFLPRRYPVLEALRLRQGYLTAPEEETQLHLLDTQIEMVSEAADLVKRKGRRVKLSVGCLAIAAGLVVAGTLIAMGGSHHV
jgi:cytochrome c biogenesis protein CcdA